VQAGVLEAQKNGMQRLSRKIHGRRESHLFG